MSGDEHRRRFTVAEASERTGLSAWTIRKLIRDGELEAVDLSAGTGKRKPRYRIPRRAVEKLRR